MGMSRRKKLLKEEKMKQESIERRYEKAFGAVKKSKTKEFIPLTMSKSYRRDLPEYPSSTAKGSDVGMSKRERKEYSGDYVVGIAGMHKSNFVPVGRGDCPESYAKMRRG